LSAAFIDWNVSCPRNFPASRRMSPFFLTCDTGRGYNGKPTCEWRVEELMRIGGVGRLCRKSERLRERSVEICIQGCSAHRDDVDLIQGERDVSVGVLANHLVLIKGYAGESQVQLKMEM
jgi:hypothetical protein